MSNEEILASVKSLESKLTKVQEDVDNLMVGCRALAEGSNSSGWRTLAEGSSSSGCRTHISRSRSSSRDLSSSETISSYSSSAPWKRKHKRPFHCSCRDKGKAKRRPSKSPPRKFWSERMEEDPDKQPDWHKQLQFPASEDEEDGRDTSHLAKVSEEKKAFLEEKLMMGVSTQEKIKARSRYPLPKVPATRTPALDPYLKTEISRQ